MNNEKVTLSIITALMLGVLFTLNQPEVQAVLRDLYQRLLMI